MTMDTKQVRAHALQLAMRRPLFGRAMESFKDIPSIAWGMLVDAETAMWFSLRDLAVFRLASKLVCASLQQALVVRVAHLMLAVPLPPFGGVPNAVFRLLVNRYYSFGLGIYSLDVLTMPPELMEHTVVTLLLPSAHEHELRWDTWAIDVAHCRVCQQRVVGAWFGCPTCDDYHLCGACADAKLKTDDQAVRKEKKVYVPTQAPAEVVTTVATRKEKLSRFWWSQQLRTWLFDHPEFRSRLLRQSQQSVASDSDEESEDPVAMATCHPGLPAVTRDWFRRMSRPSRQWMQPESEQLASLKQSQPGMPRSLFTNLARTGGQKRKSTASTDEPPAAPLAKKSRVAVAPAPVESKRRPVDEPEHARDAMPHATPPSTDIVPMVDVVAPAASESDTAEAVALAIVVATAAAPVDDVVMAVEVPQPQPSQQPTVAPSPLSEEQKREARLKRDRERAKERRKNMTDEQRKEMNQKRRARDQARRAASKFGHATRSATTGELLEPFASAPPVSVAVAGGDDDGDVEMSVAVE